ncbi:MAG: NADH:flavin oxidoreductase/NADH oxidase family protein [Burkholderiales bacterium]
MTPDISTALALPCGAVLPNRLCKAALTEGLADSMNRSTPELERLYRAWSHGGAGLVITGNVQIDRRYLERPGNVVIDRNGGIDALRRYATAGTEAGNHLWMQINHPGRQTPRHVCTEPVGPSAIPLALKGDHYLPPRAMTEAEIHDVISRFAQVCVVARATGFTGVQIHAAHGYLLSQFLSPLANHRQDDWGGSLENRARLLRDVVRACKAAAGQDFPVGVKLNSSDFQQGGFSAEDCLQVVRWLGDDGVDLLELSGGNYEQPSMMGVRGIKGAAPSGNAAQPTVAQAPVEQAAARPVAESTARREAYFMEYARSMRTVTTMPVMVTGGFRTLVAMNDALASGELDVIGLGRPMCVDVDLPAQLLGGQTTEAVSYERTIDPPKAGLAWFCLQIMRIGQGEEPDRSLSGVQAMQDYDTSETAAAQALSGR